MRKKLFLKYFLLAISIIIFIAITYCSQKSQEIDIIKPPLKPIKLVAEKLNIKDKFIKYENNAIYSEILENKKEKDKIISNNNKKALDIEFQKEKKIVNIPNNQKIKEEDKDKKHKVQIAALSTESSAISYGKKIVNKYIAEFPKIYFSINKINLKPEFFLYRLEITNFSSQSQAKYFCNQFISKEKKKTKLDCIVRNNTNSHLK